MTVPWKSEIKESCTVVVGMFDRSLFDRRGSNGDGGLPSQQIQVAMIQVSEVTETLKTAINDDGDENDTVHSQKTIVTMESEGECSGWSV